MTRPKKRTPIYRGRESDLLEEAPFAIEWIADQIREVTRDETENVRAEIERGLDNGTGYGCLVQQHFVRHPRSDYSYTGALLKSNFYHVWEVGESQKASWQGQRITLRKNGTINAESLRSSAVDWAMSKIAERASDGIMKANEREYEFIGSPTHNIARVQLTDEIGIAKIKGHTKDLKFERKVKISDLEAEFARLDKILDLWSVAI